MAGVFKRIASGAALGGAGYVAAALATLWATPKLFNGLGADAYGVLGLLLGVQGALMMILSQGGNVAVLVLLAEGDGERLAARSRGMSAWSVLAAALALAIGWALGTPLLGSLFWKDPMSLELWVEAAPWAGLGWALQILCQGLWSAQRGRLRFVQAELQQALGQTLVILAGPWALWRGAGFSGVVEAQALVWLLLLVVGLLAERRAAQPLNLMPKEDRGVWREAWGIAGWTSVALAASAVLLYGDRFYTLRLGPRELAAYSVATALSLRAASLFGLLGPLILPTLSAARGDRERWAGIQSLYMRATGISAGAVFVPLAAGGAALLGAWIAPEVEDRSRPWILLLATGGLALSLGNAYQAVLLGMGGAKEAATSAIAGAVTGLLVGKAASLLGAPGAAWMGLSGNVLMVLWRGRSVAKQGLGRAGWGWAMQSLPWLLAAVAGAVALQALGFPRWFGQGLLAILLAFALAGAAIFAAALAADAAVSKTRGRLPLLSQLLRLRQGPPA